MFGVVTNDCLRELREVVQVLVHSVIPHVAVREGRKKHIRLSCQD